MLERFVNNCDGLTTSCQPKNNSRYFHHETVLQSSGNVVGLSPIGSKPELTFMQSIMP